MATVLNSQPFDDIPGFTELTIDAGNLHTVTLVVLTARTQLSDWPAELDRLVAQALVEAGVS